MAHQEQMKQCIEECLDCHSICLETVTHCLEKGGRHAESNHIRLLLDCAEICQTSANYMLRHSNLHGAPAPYVRTCASAALRIASSSVMTLRSKPVLKPVSALLRAAQPRPRTLERAVIKTGHTRWPLY